MKDYLNSKTYAVSTVCNALMDIIVEATDKDLAHFELEKGRMHLVDEHRQIEILAYLSNHQQTVELGGSAMNAIRTLTELGHPTLFAGMVSDDEFGRNILSRASDLGIKTKLSMGSGGTGTSIILVTPDGERTMNTYLGASRLYGGDIIPHEEIADSKVFHFCGYQWDTDGQKKGINAAIATAKENGVKISFDIADPFVVEHHRQDFIDLISESADIVFANESEAKLLYGTDVQETAKIIADTGAVAVIKLGAKGALIRIDNETYEVAPVATNVVDTTAAGDMFAAGFLHGFVLDQTPESCGKMAATIASDVISRYGAVVSKDVVDQFKI